MSENWSIQLSSAINNIELSFAQQLPVEKKNYDFIPRIWKANISVEIDNSVCTSQFLSQPSLFIRCILSLSQTF